ncbi:ABC transporter permease [Streptomyces albidoflavus]|jgi:ribose/xylose/arabinose/galactoside ABC-type transport system permease subunit|uniref:ABC transporter permease n=2 Tax=Streptomyces TaxID=1883 RepID=A0ACC7XUR4_9ACTN|nr:MULTISPECIES: ABC transporter permease [Streptomyces]MBO1283840.1 ABC transporter permease [Streptomyces sampsonii]MYX83286.1 ABC transporter permease [Streptomyces sp. SID4915]NUW10223.1 ABC transporter permease [Streptomyces sp. CAI-21]QLA55095.1 ABC transporter permease [Streptomyces violascens]SCE21469.1 monosaccharide ABC transporter membrane protein, CUT2 family [Streptomyces sp. IgraMP-1]
MSSTLVADKPSGPPSSPAGAVRFRRLRHLNELGLLAAVVVLYIVLGVVAGGFLSADNQLGILRDAATVGIPALGVTLVIIAGEIDISIGPAVAFASVLFAKAASEWDFGLPIALLLTLIAGALWGSAAGWLRARFGVPSFIATLGLWSALGGLALYTTNALPVATPGGGFMEALGGKILGVPTPAVVLVLLFLVFWYVARRTAYGRSVYAVGGNAAAAQLAGIRISRVRVVLFATTGVLAALTGILMAARLGSGNGGAAAGLEFDVIAAVVIGGTALAGGRGSLVGTMLGVVFISVIANGLVLLGVNSFLQDVVRGLIIVGAVLINVVISRKSLTTRTT